MNIIIRILVTFILLFISLSKAISQDFPLDQKTPQSTIYKHLYYLQEEHYNPMKAGEIFGKANAANAEKAIQLKQIFDAHGHQITISELPSDTAYRDTLTQKTQFTPIDEYELIFLIRSKGKWIYSPQSNLAITKIYRLTFPFGATKLMSLTPSLGNGTFLGLKLWQYMGIALLFLIVFILHRIFTFLIDRIVQRLIQSTKVSADFREAIHKMSIPISYLALVQVVDWLYPTIMLPLNASRYISVAFKIIEPIFLTIALYRLVDVFGLIMRRRAEMTETSLDDQLVPLFRKSLKVFVIIFGLILLLNNLHFNLTALIAGASIGGLAFALAAQDTIKNLFGSIMIFIDRPFQIGDLVNLEGALGTVEEVGFRSTRVRTPGNSVVSVPNGKVVDMVIDNLGMRVYRRFQTNISLTYDTPIELIETYCIGLRQIITMHPKTRKDSFEVYLNEMAPSSLNILLNVFFIDDGWSSELQARHEIISEAIRLAELLKIRFAFPTQTVHLETTPGRMNPDFNYPTESKSKEELMDEYLILLKKRMEQGTMENEDL